MVAVFLNLSSGKPQQPGTSHLRFDVDWHSSSIPRSHPHHDGHSRSYRNLNYDETDALVDTFGSLMAGAGPSHDRLSVYGSIGDLSLIKHILVSLTRFLFQDQQAAHAFFGALTSETNPSLMSVLSSIDYDFLLDQADLQHLFTVFQARYEESLLFVLFFEGLVSLKASIDEDSFKRELQIELHLPLYKLSNFTTWNSRNNLEEQPVAINNIVPNCLVDVVTQPFHITEINILNSAYVFNCLLHYACRPGDFVESIENGYTLIWFDKVSKLKLNSLIYVHIFHKLDPAFRYAPQTQQLDLANEKAFIKNNSANYFRSWLAKNSLFPVSSIFDSEASQSQLISSILAQNPEKSPRSFQDIFNSELLGLVLDYFTALYDLSISDYVSEKVPASFLTPLVTFFNLKIVRKEVTAKYENQFCGNYLKYLRFKTFLLGQDLIQQKFKEAIANLELLLKINDFSVETQSGNRNLGASDSEVDIGATLRNYLEFFERYAGAQYEAGKYGAECCRELVEVGLDTQTVKVVEFFGYFEYIAFK